MGTYIWLQSTMECGCGCDGAKAEVGARRASWREGEWGMEASRKVMEGCEDEVYSHC